MSPTPESEETRPTDAEVEVAVPEGATHINKPGYIEAIQWDGGNWAECCFWALGKARFGARSGELALLVDKDGVMGEHVVPVGHWLVCQAGDKSDIWPVGADYFAEKYVALEAAAALRQPREGAEAESETPFIRGLIQTGASDETLRIAREVEGGATGEGS